jgi:hypothetical protein
VVPFSYPPPGKDGDSCASNKLPDKTKLKIKKKYLQNILTKLIIYGVLSYFCTNKYNRVLSLINIIIAIFEPGFLPLKIYKNAYK